MSWGLVGMEGWPTIKSYIKIHSISIVISHLNVTRNKTRKYWHRSTGTSSCLIQTQTSKLRREMKHYVDCRSNLQKFPRNDAFAGLARVDNTSLHIEQNHLQPQTMVHPNPLPENNSEQNTIKSANISRSLKTSCLYLEMTAHSYFWTTKIHN